MTEQQSPREATPPGEDNPQTASSSADHTAPTEQRPEDGSPATGEITDEMLPEDVRPGEDNPLAGDPDPDADDAGLSLRDEAP